MWWGSIPAIPPNGPSLPAPIGNWGETSTEGSEVQATQITALCSNVENIQKTKTKGLTFGRLPPGGTVFIMVYMLSPELVESDRKDTETVWGQDLFNVLQLVMKGCAGHTCWTWHYWCSGCTPSSWRSLKLDVGFLHQWMNWGVLQYVL